MTMRQRWVGVAAVLSLSACAHAQSTGVVLQNPTGLFSFQPKPSQSPAAQPATPPPASATAATSPGLARFGTRGQEWLTLSLGYANNFQDSGDTNFRLAWSRFLVDQIEFSPELNFWYFNQPGDNALGVNPAFTFRWHFYNEGRLSLYVDAGIGLVFSTSNTPRGGTSVNFTPKLGTGLTYQIREDSATRLQAGLRWHHISNARVAGDADNPSRDAAMIYVGLMLPF